MSSPYVGEIRMFGGSFAPAGWMTCDGQLLPISEYETLFNLIGTTYGGDGQTTFALPALNGRVPVHMGTNPGTGSTYTIGQTAGVSSVTLTSNQMPTHTHPAIADGNQATTNQTLPTNNSYGTLATTKIYSTKTTSLQQMNNQMLQSQGGSQPHDNMQPYLALTYIISLFGIFPSPT
jgi:microcystin-dependent protein